MIDNPRVDLLIARYGRTLVIVAVAVGVLALLSTGWVLATPPTTTTQQQVGQQVVESEVETSATVVRDGLWAEGTDLQNSSVYPLNDTPVVTFEPTTTVTGQRAGGDAAVRHVLEVRYAAVHDGETFWEDRETVLDERVPIVDGAARSSAALDVRDVLDRRDAVEADLDGVGRLYVSVRFRAEYDTGTNEGVLEGETPLVLRENAYWFGGPISDDEPHPEYRTVETTASPNPLLVGALSLLSAAGFGAAAFVRLRAPVDVAAARRAVHERRYAEWISHGTIPMWIGDHHVALDSLADVVDVAIDAGERVVHDRQRGLFAVVNDDVVYYYSERGVWEETAWPDIDLESRPDIEPPSGNGPPVGGPPPTEDADETPGETPDEDASVREP